LLWSAIAVLLLSVIGQEKIKFLTKLRLKTKRRGDYFIISHLHGANNTITENDPLLFVIGFFDSQPIESDNTDKVICSY
jgi:hypothetical protein